MGLLSHLSGPEKNYQRISVIKSCDNFKIYLKKKTKQNRIIIISSFFFLTKNEEEDQTQFK